MSLYDDVCKMKRIIMEADCFEEVDYREFVGPLKYAHAVKVLGQEEADRRYIETKRLPKF